MNLLHENHEEPMDDAEETIIDLRSVTLEVFYNPLQSNHAKEVGGSFGNVGEGDTLEIRKCGVF